MLRRRRSSRNTQVVKTPSSTIVRIGTPIATESVELDIEWIRAPLGDNSALGKGRFPFKRRTIDSKEMLIQDIQVQGKVTFVELKARPRFNHVMDIEVEEDQIAKVKGFVRSYNGLPMEESGQLKWHDTPIQSPGNILRFISKQGLDEPFLEVWNVSTIDDIMDIDR